MSGLKRLAKRAFAALGYEVRRAGGFPQVPEYSPEDRALVESVSEFTMTTAENRWATLKAARYVHAAGLPGAVVECGVWRGGMMMVAAKALLALNAPRDLWLFDTFAGMTKPTAHDTHDGGVPALPSWAADQRGGRNDWCYASADDVRRNLASTGYPMERVRLVEGPVETTLRSKELPDAISVLRLDTDFYESTAAELEVLYPRLAPGGVLIVDDYGHWSGARKAVDEYLARTGEALLLLPIDAAGARLALKPARSATWSA